ncbi:putative DNA primase [Encephalitozoon cuniculi EcunIII-L]|nr:putative DNA primase [Encephalitozoon cuniculi EcunIII-L]
MKRAKTAKEGGWPGITFYTALSKSSVDYETFRKCAERRIEMLRCEEGDGIISKCLSTSIEEDILSHFFCRVVCSQDAWNAVWFVNAEVNLLRLRISKNPGGARAFFLSEVLPHMDGARTQDGVLVLGMRSRYNPDVVASAASSEVLVHFTKVIDLIGKRAVVPEGGYLRLNDEGIGSLLVNEFRRYLSNRMDELVEISSNEPDERMRVLSTSLLANPTGYERGTNFSLESSERYFPPCMQDIMERLRKNKHLKYNDRQTLCLFLKDCGMSVEDGIAFFRGSFKAPREVFDKEYLYSIRHNYGLEGKRANYSCFSCSKIANMTNEERRSSCPFVGDPEHMRERIKDVGADIEDIMGEGPFNGKCTRLLEKLTCRKQSRLVATPVRYYLECKDPERNGGEI